MRAPSDRRSPTRASFLRAISVLLAGGGPLLTGLAPSLRADIQNPGRSRFPGERVVQKRGERPPNALPQTVAVGDGGTVTITLRARSRPGETVRFLLRQPPAHGTFDAAPRQLTPGTAAVTYVLNPDDHATEDSFTYAVQAGDSPVSAEERVSLRIPDAPPSLVASPAELDFGAVKSGESTGAEFTLVNQGGGEAVGVVEPPVPWVVDGSADYRLPRGMSQRFRLVFKPRDEQVYREAVHFRNNADGVRLVGTGLGDGTPRLAAAAPLPEAAPAEVIGPVQALFSSDSPVPTPSPPPTARPTPAGAAAAPVGDTVSPLPPDTNDVGVAGFTVLAQGRTTLDLAWKVPVPPPRSYRVERRNLSLDGDDKLVVQWIPYALVNFKTTNGQVTAHLSGLDANSQECLRVLAVNSAGLLSPPSPMLVTFTLPAATWYRLTPLKGLFAVLLLLGFLVVRRRWETHQILREIDESRQRQTALR